MIKGLCGVCGQSIDHDHEKCKATVLPVKLWEHYYIKGVDDDNDIYSIPFGAIVTIIVGKENNCIIEIVTGNIYHMVVPESHIDAYRKWVNRTEGTGVL